MPLLDTEGRKLSAAQRYATQRRGGGRACACKPLGSGDDFWGCWAVMGDSCRALDQAKTTLLRVIMCSANLISMLFCHVSHRIPSHRLILMPLIVFIVTNSHCSNDTGSSSAAGRNATLLLRPSITNGSGDQHSPALCARRIGWNLQYVRLQYTLRNAGPASARRDLPFSAKLHSK